MARMHFVGIKGVAMTALAVWAKEQGHEVTGSDVSEEFPTDAVLRSIGVSPYATFSPDHVSGDMVIYTGAHGGRENVEVIEAMRQHIPSFPHGRALGRFMEPYRQISVSGCHGKTTTTAMIVTICMRAGVDPSYVIGSGEVRGLGLPGHFGKGSYFIAEADEYATEPGRDHTPRFLWQTPDILVVTSIDYDHPDVYSSIDDVGKAYQLLAEKSRVIVANADDAGVQSYLLSRYRNIITYGVSSGDLVVRYGEQKPWENNGVLHVHGEEIPIVLRIPGTHNLLNAAAAFLVAKQIGVETRQIVDALAHFGGASRRFEYIGTYHGALVIDDYAHHPREIVATINAARSWYPNHRIHVVFQPHTYSRTVSLLNEFGTAFAGADAVGILPIYASAREREQTIKSETVVEEAKKHHSSVSFYSSAQSFLEQSWSKHDIILSLGAGDIGRQIREAIQKQQ